MTLSAAYISGFSSADGTKKKKLQQRCHVEPGLKGKVGENMRTIMVEHVVVFLLRANAKNSRDEPLQHNPDQWQILQPQGMALRTLALRLRIVFENPGLIIVSTLSKESC